MIVANTLIAKAVVPGVSLSTRRVGAENFASLERIARIAARVGCILLTHGADTRHALRRIVEIAGYLGRDVHVVVTADAVLVTVVAELPCAAAVEHRLGDMSVDMGKLLSLERVLDDIRFGLNNVDAIEARLDAVETRGGYSVLAMMLGIAVTGGALARLFGADWPVVFAACLAGFISVWFRHVLNRVGFNAMATVFSTAFVSGVCSVVALSGGAGGAGISPVLCLTAAGMILVPGVPLINGVRDIAAGYPGNGMVRLVLGVTTLLAIGFALFLAATLAGDAMPVDMAPASMTVSEDVLFAALAALGYAVFFNVPARLLWVCILCGMVSHGLRTALMHSGLDIATASLLGAFFAGGVAMLVGTRLRVPPVAFAFPGIVAMVPGSYGFRAGIGGLHLMNSGSHASLELMANTVSLTITTIIVTTAIATGLLLALSLGPDLRNNAVSNAAGR